MSDASDKITRLRTALSEATPTKPKRGTACKPTAPVGNVIYVNGDGVAVGQIAGGDIHNHHHVNQKPPRPRVSVVPGGDVISEAQKVDLVNLRNEWIALHNAVKQKPLSIPSAQKSINDKAGVTSYHLISSASYPFLVKWIKVQMGRIRNMASAPKKDPKWRASKIGGIKAHCKNDLGNPDYYKPYIKENFGKDSLSDLSVDELQQTYAYIMRK